VMATLAAAASVTVTVLVAVAVHETVPVAVVFVQFMVRLAVKEVPVKPAGTVNVGELVVGVVIVIPLLVGVVTAQL